MIRVWGERIVGVVLLVAIVALVAGHLLGTPVLLSFVETGSMEPTIETGDGFVAIPGELAGEPSVGDVVVFDAQEIEGGGLTTHRIVDEADGGYVTQGDANPATDQESGEPLVQDAQVVAHAWSVGDTVVTIPHLGTAVMGLGDGLESVQHWLAFSLGLDFVLDTGVVAMVVLGLSVLLYLGETIRERRERSFTSRLGRDRAETAVDPRLLCVCFALLVAVAAGAAMVVPGGTHTYDVVSAEFDSERPLVIEGGTTETVTHDVPNAGVVPVVTYVEPASDTAAVDTERVTVGPRSEEAVTVTISAPDDPGYYPTHVTEHRYLAVLPASVIDGLHEAHPWLPIVTIVSLAGGVTYAVGRLLLGTPSARDRRAARRREAGTRQQYE